MKAWVLVDAENGYTWGWKLYTGKEEGQVASGLAHRVVMDLVSDDRLENKGYVVVTDNFYSSPELFRALVEKGFAALGTARKDRRGIPVVIQNASLQKGKFETAGMTEYSH